MSIQWITIRVKKSTRDLLRKIKAKERLSGYDAVIAKLELESYLYKMTLVSPHKADKKEVGSYLHGSED